MSAPPAPQEQQPNNSIEAPERVRDYASPTECSDLREHYNACFFRWYQEDFLQNYTTELGCDTEWRAYNACIQKKLRAWKLDSYDTVQVFTTKHMKHASDSDGTE